MNLRDRARHMDQLKDRIIALLRSELVLLHQEKAAIISLESEDCSGEFVGDLCDAIFDVLANKANEQ